MHDLQGILNLFNSFWLKIVILRYYFCIPIVITTARNNNDLSTLLGIAIIIYPILLIKKLRVQMLRRFNIVTKLVFGGVNTWTHFCKTPDSIANYSPGKQCQVRWPGFKLIPCMSFFPLCVPPFPLYTMIKSFYSQECCDNWVSSSS